MNDFFRPRLLDVTMRDGGLTNDFRFDDDFARALMHVNRAMGVSCMEIGYKASSRLFDREDYGKWKFCREDDVCAVFGEKPDVKLAVMADAGRCDCKTDIPERASSPISLVRVACYYEQLSEALDMISDIKNKGYETSLNLMAVSRLSENKLKSALTLMASSDADIIYMVDSFGALLPEDAARIARLYAQTADEAGKLAGIHTHDNLSLALANTLHALRSGVSCADAAYAGLGRGAGSCRMEALLGCLMRMDATDGSARDEPSVARRLRPALEFIQNRALPNSQNARDPYSAPVYLLTGLENVHPRAAMAFLREGGTNLASFADEMLSDRT